MIDFGVNEFYLVRRFSLRVFSPSKCLKIISKPEKILFSG
jgi:hypothetical protein